MDTEKFTLEELIEKNETLKSKYQEIIITIYNDPRKRYKKFSFQNKEFKILRLNLF